MSWRKEGVCLALALCVAVALTVEGDADLGRDGNSMAFALLEMVAIGNDTDNDLDGCYGQLADLGKALAERQLWALKMVDSSGGPGPGLLWGNNYWLGSIEFCRELRLHKPLVLASTRRANLTAAPGSLPPFDVHFAVATFELRAPQQLRVGLPNEDVVFVGLCLPRTCSPARLRPLLKSLVEARPLSVQHLYDVTMTLTKVRIPQDTVSWKTQPLFVVVALLVVGLLGLVVTATLYDLLIRLPRLRAAQPVDSAQKESLVTSRDDNDDGDSCAWRCLVCFSAYSNTALLFGGSVGEGSVRAIHGLRFLTMIWIILAHTSFYGADYGDNKPFAYRLTESFLGQVAINGTLSTDTFFVLSGFLLSYQFARSERDASPAKTVSYRKKALLLLGIIAKRFLRLTPAYMAMILVITATMSWHAHTAIYMPVERPDLLCTAYWWRNLLYINNLFPAEQMCVSWSWFLANDMQFFVIGSVILIVASSRKELGAAMLVVILTASLILTGYLAYTGGYILTVDEMFARLNEFYYPPWVRVGPYLVGVATGLLVVRLDGSLGLGKCWVWTLWALAVAFNSFAIFGLYERDMSLLYATFYAAMGRTLWGLGIAWVLIACCTHQGGLVGHVLSLPAWVPWSRLTYGAYLINPLIIHSVNLAAVTAVHVNFVQFLTLALGVAVLSYAGALLLALAVETPSILLVKQLTERKPASRAAQELPSR